MCMFNNKISKVHATKIFVGPVSVPGIGPWQMTVYQNLVAQQQPSKRDDSSDSETEDGFGNEFDGLNFGGADDERQPMMVIGENAMVLPFPVAFDVDPLDPDDDSRFTVQGNNDIIRLLDMKKWEQQTGTDFFETLERVFDDDSSEDEAAHLFGDRFAPQSRRLEVTQVGNYRISVARSWQDLKHMDKGVFQLNDDLGTVLQTHYSTGFGFVICKFDSNIGVESHPVAYIHSLRGSNLKYFVPCRHHHGTREKKYVDDWDHQIYVMNGGERFASKQSNTDPFTQASALKYLKEMVCTAGAETIPFDTIRKKEIRGRHKNKDFVFFFSGAG